eukprot:COSAG02_NODE_2002_length_10139_cov_4.784761_5_plen_231_part_00
MAALALLTGPSLAADEGRFNLGFPGSSPEWNYGGNGGLTSWSYYLRAFNLVQGGNGASEVGWGQWSKPGAPPDFNEVCGVNPLGLACTGEEGGENGEPGCVAHTGAEGVETEAGCEATCRWEAEAEADELAGTNVCEKATWTTNTRGKCGAADYAERQECTFWVCGDADGGGVRGSIEGGMGYWPYTLEKDQVTWMLPGATSANYEIFVRQPQSVRHPPVRMRRDNLALF